MRLDHFGNRTVCDSLVELWYSTVSKFSACCLVDHARSEEGYNRGQQKFRAQSAQLSSVLTTHIKRVPRTRHYCICPRFWTIFASQQQQNMRLYWSICTHQLWGRLLWAHLLALGLWTYTPSILIVHFVNCQPTDVPIVIPQFRRINLSS